MGILITAPARRREPPVEPAALSVAAGDARNALHIREVVRITGLRREQLYMWQRRYNFPAPLRAFGVRLSPDRSRA
jgi:predicted DNA-binding transcriptional regulator AlpA